MYNSKLLLVFLMTKNQEMVVFIFPSIVKFMEANFLVRFETKSSLPIRFLVSCYHLHVVVISYDNTGAFDFEYARKQICEQW